MKILKYFVALSLVLAGSLALAKNNKKTTDDADTTAPKKTAQDLSPEDQAILKRGELSMGKYITGGMIGTAIGFGIGHAIQDRYAEMGWIFTATESVALATYIVGVAQCHNVTDSYGDRTYSCNDGAGAIVVGLSALIGFHIWETVDVWLTPARRNRRYRELKSQVGSADSTQLMLVPTIVMNRLPGLGVALTF